MKVRHEVISDLAYRILAGLMDDELGDITPKLCVVEEAELAIYLKKCLAQGKKRIVIDVIPRVEA